MRVLDFGKNKGKILADCEESYLKWLASHEKVVARRNQWACRDARFILSRMAKVAEAKKVVTQMELNIPEFIATKNVEQESTDISNKGTLYKPFALLR